MKKRQIWIKTSFKGTHNWPECPYEDVSFLRDRHFHIFHVKVTIDVEHNDRDIEFIRFKNFIDEAISHYGIQYGGNDVKELGRMSCEDIADDLHRAIESRYPDRSMVIDISEDEHVGATIIYESDYDQSGEILGEL